MDHRLDNLQEGNKLYWLVFSTYESTVKLEILTVKRRGITSDRAADYITIDRPVVVERNGTTNRCYNLFAEDINKLTKTLIGRSIIVTQFEDAVRLLTNWNLRENRIESQDVDGELGGHLMQKRISNDTSYLMSIEEEEQLFEQIVLGADSIDK